MSFLCDARSPRGLGDASGLAAEAVSGLAYGLGDGIAVVVEVLGAGGIDYVLLVDPTGSRSALSTFAEEIMPAFPDC